MRSVVAGRLAAGLICLACLPCRAPAAADLAYPVGDFALTDQDGHEVHASDLLGKVWVASFIFTRCAGPCPHVSATMEQLQHDFAGEPDVRLVTFTVDPEYDTPEVLKRYAERFHADPGRWLFLTGKPAEVDRVLRRGISTSGAEKNTAADATPGTAVTHDTHLAVVDRQGRVRDYFSGLPDDDSDDAAQDQQEGTGPAPS